MNPSGKTIRNGLGGATCVFVGVGYLFGNVFRSMLGHLARDFSMLMLGVFVLMFGIMFVVHRVQKRRLTLPPRGATGAAVPPT